MIKKIFRVLFPIIGGGIVSLLIMGYMETYNGLNKPPLSPPSIVFPIVWTILYLFIGLAYNKYREDNDNKETIILYYLQLALNFIWPILFFNLNLYLVALIILLALLILTYILTKTLNSKLFIPYIIWLVIATYLNIGIVILN